MTQQEMSKFRQTNAVYEFKWPIRECFSNNSSNAYIDFTTTTMSCDLTCHLAIAQMKTHIIKWYKIKL